MSLTEKTEITDKALIESHIRGDKSAFKQIVLRYSDGLYGYLYKMTGNKEQTEDIFQETFKRVHEKAHTFGSGKFKAWLFKIATNLAMDSFRKQKKQPSTVSFARVSDESDCDLMDNCIASDCSCGFAAAVEKEQVNIVRNAVNSLPYGQKTALVLTYYENLSYAQAADIMGCSIGSVKSHISRAMRKLACILPDPKGAEK